MGCVLFDAAAGITERRTFPIAAARRPCRTSSQEGSTSGCNIITSGYPQVRDQLVKAPALLSAQARTAAAGPRHRAGAGHHRDEFDAGSSTSLFLPKGTPEPIVRKLNAASDRKR